MRPSGCEAAADPASAGPGPAAAARRAAAAAGAADGAALGGAWGSLPAHGALVAEFGLFDGGACRPQAGPSGEVRCGCAGCARWAAFVRGRLPEGPAWPQYEVFTREFVASLAAYLRQRGAAYGLPRMRWLEVGAGDGRLAGHLRAALRRLWRLAPGGPRVDLECTDSGLNGLHAAAARGGGVELEDAAAAVARRAPHGVLCCWQPLGADWTAAFRACPSVREYVLVGEPDAGICGHPWLTWGVPAACPDSGLTSGSSSGAVCSGDGCAWVRSTACSRPDAAPCSPAAALRTRTQQRLCCGPRRASPPAFAGGKRARGASLPDDDAHVRARPRRVGGACPPGGRSPRVAADDARTGGGQHTAAGAAGRTAGAGLHGGSGRASPESPGGDGGRYEAGAQRVPPYVVEGFARVDLPQLSRWQLCGTDERWLARRHSASVSFRRAGAAPG